MNIINRIIKQLPCKVDQYFVYLLLGALCCILFAFDNFFNYESYSYLAFERDGFVKLQYWRAISAHLLHTNIWHLILNLMGLLLLWLLHGDYANSRSLLLQCIVLGIGISASIYLFAPNVIWYVGLSGILHGLFVIGAIIDIQKNRVTGYLLLTGVIIKIVDEQISEPDAKLQALIQANVVIEAHLYGLILGFIIGGAIIFKKK